MGYFRTCPICGSNLDPGERCTDCRPAHETATGDSAKQETPAVLPAGKMTLILPAHRTGRREVV